MIDSLLGNSRALWRASLALGIGIITIAAVLLFGTFWGDPVIYLPYARNNALGDFFSYNPGQFSSGATSPLWSLVLAVPYLFGADVVGAKFVAALVTIASFGVLAAMTARVNGREAGSGVALLYAVEMMTIYGLMMYESPLAVAAVALTIILGDRLRMRWADSGALPPGPLMALAAAWSLLPLSRPDAALLVPLQIAALWLTAPTRDLASLFKLVAAALVAAVPAALYFGYSYFTLGAISVSSKCRAFALRESADRFGPLIFSRAALTYLGSILFALVIAAVGLDRLRTEDRTRWLALYGVASIVLYAVLLVFVQPVTNDLPRYFLPIAPFIVLAVGRALVAAQRRLAMSPRAWTISAALVCLLFVVRPTLSVLAEAIDQSRRGYTFDEIIEREAAEKINAIARSGESVLAYEVQARYALRPDVSLLSLDGITDGLVAPYLESADMGAFLRRYRPTYWIANNAGNYRPYLRRSMLQRAIEASRRGGSAVPGAFAYSEGGVSFELLDQRTRPMPRGFTGWTMIYRLHYADSAR